MEFFETSIFTKLIQKLLRDKEYHLLQLQLSVRPESGDIIKGSGGIRKLRWAGSGRGKRGGIRVIYYYITEDEKIYMLYAYPKSKQDDLTADQLKQLKQLVEDQLS
ncbi:type II toxin-antitoxin system RelE/ParE family toxin [Gracilimonas mengyeensis]|uniref:RelE toxin of RelE / RelB toxin-antitoxin system n=1 Tax=Gracilimonas mengyeensis TaxID=1302730 RepID=A0A521BEN6_9BACT|nr:type II toxin-antitoxin system RelE/ParE family toxin [Gracilimonas mengyeensis]SMO45556.1 RelE toxin of RelE / RelB toxin-antitoxin system [Gracilimonas mengyeensis]